MTYHIRYKKTAKDSFELVDDLSEESALKLYNDAVLLDIEYIAVYKEQKYGRDLIKEYPHRNLSKDQRSHISFSIFELRMI